MGANQERVPVSYRIAKRIKKAIRVTEWLINLYASLFTSVH